MPIMVQCEKCGTTYSISDERAGGVEQCRCGNSILVPKAPEGPRPDAARKRRSNSEDAEAAACNPAFNSVFASLTLMLGVSVAWSCVLTPRLFLGERLGRVTDLATATMWVSYTIAGVLMIVSAVGLFRLRPWAWWVAVATLSGSAFSHISGLLGGPSPFVITVHRIVFVGSLLITQALQLGSLLVQVAVLLYYLRVRRCFAARQIPEIKPWLALMSLAPLIVDLCVLRPMVGHVAFSPDGKTLAASIVHRSPLWGTGLPRGQVLLWNTDTGQLQRRIRTAGRPVSLTFSPDGASLAAGITARSFPEPTGEARVWNTQTGEPELALRVEVGPVTRLTFSPDGRTLVGDHGRGIAFWDAASGKLKCDLSTPTGLNYSAWSLDCRTVAISITEELAVGASGRDQYTHIEVWDAPMGKLRATLPKRPGYATPFALSPDGTMLAATQSSSQGTEVTLWDVPTGRLRRTLTDRNLDQGSLCFSPDGRTLLYEWPRRGWSPDLGIGSVGRASYYQPLWDTETGELKWRREGTVWPGRGCAFSPDGRTIAFVNGFRTGLARAIGASQPNGSQEQVCDTQTGRAIWTAPRHSGIGMEIAFSPDGTRVASWAADGKVRLFDARTGKLVRTF